MVVTAHGHSEALEPDVAGIRFDQHMPLTGRFRSTEPLKAFGRGHMPVTFVK
jgi:hypothetical protein